MIGRTNTGGGGGLQDTDALLRVQAPAGSVVTITKGGMTKTDHGHENADDNSVYDYYFIIHQSQFDSVNPWTVTATLGTQTSSGTIIINAVDEYDMELTYRVYLIQNGAFVSGITWTTNGSSTPSISAQTGYIAFYASSGNNTATALAYPTSKVSLRNKSTLHVKFYLHNGHYGQSRDYGTVVPAIGVSTTTPSVQSGPSVPAWIASQHITVVSNYINTEEVTLDISTISDDCYISLCCGSSDFRGALWLSDVWVD